MEQKRGERKQTFLKGWQAGPRGGCLKNGSWNPLMNYVLHIYINKFISYGLQLWFKGFEIPKGETKVCLYEGGWWLEHEGDHELFAI